MTLRVLVVEDEQGIRSMLQSSLAAEGFEVQTAVSVREATAMLQHSPPEVVLLDLGLPDGDGIEVLRQVRSRSVAPVLVVSARHLEAEKVKLLDEGADDYLVKPFSVGELLARIRVAMRRRGTAVNPALMAYDCGDLKVDLNSRLVELKGKPVHLTPTEFRLLSCLVRSAGTVVTHRQLLAQVWGAEFVEHTHYLRLYMGQLRAKIEQTPAEPRYILTETGVGYRLAGR